VKRIWNFKTLSAALIIGAGMGCAGPKQANQPMAQQQQTAAQTANSSPSTPAPAAQIAAVDELDAAIRDASDYLNGKVPKGNKIVILNVQSVSTGISNYIIDELMANAVNDGFFTVVDRQQLDVIQKEQSFQMSGAVDDKDAQEIGRFFGAQTIVSGAVNRLGATGYRVTIRALEVETAQVQGQYNRNIASSAIMNSLMESRSNPTGNTAMMYSEPAPAPVSVAAEPPIQGNSGSQSKTAFVDSRDGGIGQPLNDIVGKWKGTYTANQGETGLTLTVYSDRDAYRAIFEFYSLAGKRNAAHGSYHMNVSYNPSTERYFLRGYKWINRPSNYRFVHLDGVLSGNVFKGTLSGTKYTFSVTKM